MGANSSSRAPSARSESRGVGVAVKERFHAYLPKRINLHAVLTEEKIKLVQDHWNLIADEQDIGMVGSRPAGDQLSRSGDKPSCISIFYDAFYEKLFEKAPDARKLFDGNMVRQSRALVKMVLWLCHLEITDDLIPKLERLADRHVGYGCLPVHYEAGGDALQHALQAVTSGGDEGETKVVMEAWQDVYSFVLLIVIPRTAMRLEETTRTSGPVSTRLRSAPISGTRLKAHSTPTCNSNRRQAHGDSFSCDRQMSRSPQRSFSTIGTPHTALATPQTASTENEEWFGTVAVLTDDSRIIPGGGGGGRNSSNAVAADEKIARSASGSSFTFTRNTNWRSKRRSSMRGRSSDSVRGTRRRSGPCKPNLESLDSSEYEEGGQTRSITVKGGSGREGEGGVKGNDMLGAPYIGQPNGEHSPGENVAMFSSMAYLRIQQLRLSVSSAATGFTGPGSVCASPNDSILSSSTASRPKDEGRRSKIWRGLSKFSGSGKGGGGVGNSADNKNNFRGPTRPRTQRETAASSLQNRCRDGRARSFEGGSLSRVGVTAPVHAKHDRLANLRQKSAPVEKGTSTVTTVAIGTTSCDGSKEITSSSSGVGGGNGDAKITCVDEGMNMSNRPLRTRIPNSSHIDACLLRVGDNSSRDDVFAALPSPAKSTISLPTTRAEKPSSALITPKGGRGSNNGCSQWRTARAAAVVPTTGSPSAAVVVALSEFGSNAGFKISRPLEAFRLPSQKSGRDAEGNGGETSEIPSCWRRASLPRSFERESPSSIAVDKVAGVEKVTTTTTTVTASAPAVAAAALPRSFETPPPCRKKGYGGKRTGSVQLSASSKARMENMSFNRNGILGCGVAVRRSKPAEDRCKDEVDKRKGGELDMDSSHPDRRLRTPGGGQGARSSKEKAVAMDPLFEVTESPTTPNNIGVRSTSAELTSCFSTDSRTGSRRTGRRALEKSRRSHGDCQGLPSGDFSPKAPPKIEKILHQGGSTPEDGSLKRPTSLKLAPKALAKWGFLQDEKRPPIDKKIWLKLPGNSSGGDSDEIRASAQAFWHAREREKLKHEETAHGDRQARGDAFDYEGVRMLPTRRELQQEREKEQKQFFGHDHQTAIYATENEEGLPVSSPSPADITPYSPTPEELVAMEIDESCARQKKQRPPRGVPTPAALPTSPALLAPLLRPHGTETLAQHRAAPSLRRRARSLPRVPDRFGSKDSEVVGTPTALRKEKKRMVIPSSTPTAASHGAMVKFREQGKSPLPSSSSRGPPMSPPPPLLLPGWSTTPTTIDSDPALSDSHLVRVTEDCDCSDKGRRTAVSGGLCSWNKTSDTCGLADGFDEGNRKTQPAIGATKRSTATPPPHHHPARRGGDAVATATRLVIAEFPLTLLDSYSPMQLHLEVTPQQCRQLRFVKMSAERPMSLPPFDDGQDEAPEPDHLLSMSTPAVDDDCMATNAMVIVADDDGFEETGNSEEGSCCCEEERVISSSSPLVYLSDALAHHPSSQWVKGEGARGNLRQRRLATPKPKGGGASHGLPQTFKSLMSVWNSTSNVSMDSEYEEEEVCRKERVVVDSNASTDKARIQSGPLHVARNGASAGGNCGSTPPRAPVRNDQPLLPLPADTPEASTTWGNGAAISVSIAKNKQRRPRTSPIINSSTEAISSLAKSVVVGAAMPFSEKSGRGAHANRIKAVKPAPSAAAPVAAPGPRLSISVQDEELVCAPSSDRNVGLNQTTAVRPVEIDGAFVFSAFQGKFEAEIENVKRISASPASGANGPSSASVPVVSKVAARIANDRQGLPVAPAKEGRVNGVVVALHSSSSGRQENSSSSNSSNIVGDVSTAAFSSVLRSPSPSQPSSRSSLTRLLLPAPSSAVSEDITMTAKTPSRSRVETMTAALMAPGRGTGGQRGAFFDGGTPLVGARGGLARAGLFLSSSGSFEEGLGNDTCGKREVEGKRRAGPMEGLAFGNVRQKASEWGKTSRCP